MAYASLRLTNDEILKSIALVAGINRAPSSTNWDTNIQSDIREVIRCGLRRFYNPPPIDGVIHTWRFLERKFYAARPIDDAYATGTVAVTGGTATLTGGTFPTWAADGVLSVGGHTLFVTLRTDGAHLTVNNDGLVVAAGAAYTIYRWRFPMPDDFGEFIGGVPYEHPVYGRKLRSVDETEIRLRWTATFRIGQTSIYCVAPKNSSNDAANWYFTFWGGMDAGAGVTATYRSVPLDNLDTADLFAGPTIIQADPVHAQTMLQAILASAEEFYQGGPGNHTDQFNICLQASVMHDRQSSGPTDFSGDSDRRGKEFYLLNHVPSYDVLP